MWGQPPSAVRLAKPGSCSSLNGFPVFHLEGNVVSALGLTRFVHHYDVATCLYDPGLLIVRDSIRLQREKVVCDKNRIFVWNLLAAIDVPVALAVCFTYRM